AGECDSRSPGNNPVAVTAYSVGCGSRRCAAAPGRGTPARPEGRGRCRALEVPSHWLSPLSVVSSPRPCDLRFGWYEGENCLFPEAWRQIYCKHQDLQLGSQFADLSRGDAPAAREACARRRGGERRRAPLGDVSPRTSRPAAGPPPPRPTPPPASAAPPASTPPRPAAPAPGSSTRSGARPPAR